MSSNKLPAYEWSIILLFCAILTVLSFLALRKPETGDGQAISVTGEEVPMTLLQVYIEGAVAHPGKYYLPPESSLNDLLTQAVLLPEADRSRLKPRNLLRNGQRITIPKQKPITVHIEGAANNTGPLKVLSGMRCAELVSVIDFMPEADIQGLLKRTRYLKEGDVVLIKYKERKRKTVKTSSKRKIKRKGVARKK